MNEEKVDAKAAEETTICPLCLGEKIWPFADVAYGMMCQICSGIGRVSLEVAKVAIEQGW